MPVIKNLKKKGLSALTKSKNRARASSSSGARASPLTRTNKPASTSTKKKRPQIHAKFNADAWDAGAVERTEQEKAVKRSEGSSKRIRFDPAPATLVLPSKESELRQKMGEFAGPLLGALWDEKPSTLTTSVSFEPRKEAPPATKRNANKFSALASDSEEGEDMDVNNNSSKIVFKAPTLDLNRVKAVAFQPKDDPFAFKPSLLDANRLLKGGEGQSASASTSFSVDFKQASFEVPAFQTSTLFQAPAASSHDDFDDL